jgi:hypothetical protein
MQTTTRARLPSRSRMPAHARTRRRRALSLVLLLVPSLVLSCSRSTLLALVASRPGRRLAHSCSHAPCSSPSSQTGPPSLVLQPWFLLAPSFVPGSLLPCSCHRTCPTVSSRCSRSVLSRASATPRWGAWYARSCYGSRSHSRPRAPACAPSNSRRITLPMYGRPDCWCWRSRRAAGVSLAWSLTHLPLFGRCKAGSR